MLHESGCTYLPAPTADVYVMPSYDDLTVQKFAMSCPETFTGFIKTDKSINSEKLCWHKCLYRKFTHGCTLISWN